MELFDLFFWTIGRGIQKVCAVTGLAKFNLSDGGRWSLGFFFNRCNLSVGIYHLGILVCLNQLSFLK